MINNVQRFFEIKKISRKATNPRDEISRYYLSFLFPTFHFKSNISLKITDPENPLVLKISYHKELANIMEF
jgi:hypothetical protein